MIIELVLVIPRSTGLDSKLGATGRPVKAGRRPPKGTGKARGSGRPAAGEAKKAKPAKRSNTNQGAVAQLGERLICIQEVAGSIPTSSTKWACSSGG